MYINEATNEIISKDNNREGKIKIEKHISIKPICQDGKISSDKMIVMSDDLSTSVEAHLNYMGDKGDIEETGRALVDAPFGAC